LGDIRGASRMRMCGHRGASWREVRLPLALEDARGEVFRGGAERASVVVEFVEAQGALARLDLRHVRLRLVEPCGDVGLREVCRNPHVAQGGPNGLVRLDVHAPNNTPGGQISHIGIFW